MRQHVSTIMCPACKNPWEGCYCTDDSRADYYDQQIAKDMKRKNYHIIRKGSEVLQIVIADTGTENNRFRVYLEEAGFRSNWRVTVGRGWPTIREAKQFLENKGWKFV